MYVCLLSSALLLLPRTHAADAAGAGGAAAADLDAGIGPVVVGAPLSRDAAS